MKKKSELEKMVEALPPNPKQARKWTLEEDSIILKYTSEKGAEAIGKVIKAPGLAVRRRLAQLKAGIK